MNGNRIANLKSMQKARRTANVLAWQWMDECERILASGGKPERLSVIAPKLVLESRIMRRTPSTRSVKIVAEATVKNGLRLLGTFRDKYVATISYFVELGIAEKAAIVLKKIYQPVVVSWGAGVDSTAMIIGMLARGERIDLVTFADTGSEKPETYAFIPVFIEWLAKRGVPVAVVSYKPSNFKHWPPYKSLTENCLTNGTLPSISFGFKSCSLKWKVVPQDKAVEEWELAIKCWAEGGKVIRCIGYDCSPADQKRYADNGDQTSSKYEYRYPLREYGWKRDDCENAIREAGLPVPIKSACFFCGASKPKELHFLSLTQLRVIVLMEARSAPRLEGWMNQEQLDALYEKKVLKWERVCAQRAKKGQKAPKAPRRFIAGKDGVQGLWRRGNKGTKSGVATTGRMTDYIREKALLPAEEIDRIWNAAPTELIKFQAEFANGEHAAPLKDWLEHFNQSNDALGQNDPEQAIGLDLAAIPADQLADMGGSYAALAA